MKRPGVLSIADTSRLNPTDRHKTPHEETLFLTTEFLIISMAYMANGRAGRLGGWMSVALSLELRLPLSGEPLRLIDLFGSHLLRDPVSTSYRVEPRAA